MGHRVTASYKLVSRCEEKNLLPIIQLFKILMPYIAFKSCLCEGVLKCYVFDCSRF